jgi:hypothetical protein
MTRFDNAILSGLAEALVVRAILELVREGLHVKSS